MLASDCRTAGHTFVMTSRRPHRDAMAMPSTASDTAMTTSSLLLLGSENPLPPPRPAQAKKRNSSTMWTIAAGDDVEAHARHRFGRRHAGLLQVAHVEGHAADVGRRHPVDERRGELDLHRRDERQVLGRPHRSCRRRGDVREARHDDAGGDPSPVGGTRALARCRRRWPVGAAGSRRRRSAWRS